MTTRPAARPPGTAWTYYQQVQDTVLVQLSGRGVAGFGRSPAGHRVVLHITETQDLEEAVRSGVVSFWLTGLDAPGLALLRIRPGEGSEIDTVATATLSIATSMAHDGLASTAMTDGAGGLYLVAWAVGGMNAGAGAAGYAAALTRSAPELATDRRDDSDGRALIEVLSPDREGLPSPYSLVADHSLAADRCLTADRAEHDGHLDHEHLGVVVPLTLDEVAAASAGMPLEIDPADVPARIAAYGDLAAAWAQATRGPA
ncbi:hypothetical protein ABIB25_000431 [Nakamurella sp. UYEF19]|uniref:hypothetical protein n=1 Tax=Nakamurella sp. UYEF19 TaxID=1756392 RepID=UPI0033958119